MKGLAVIGHTLTKPHDTTRESAAVPRAQSFDISRADLIDAGTAISEQAIAIYTRALTASTADEETCTLWQRHIDALTGYDGNNPSEEIQDAIIGLGVLAENSDALTKAHLTKLAQTLACHAEFTRSTPSGFASAADWFNEITDISTEIQMFARIRDARKDTESLPITLTDPLRRLASKLGDLWS